MNYTVQGSDETLIWTFDFTDALLTGDTLAGSTTVTSSEGAVASIVTATPQVSAELSGVPFGRIAKLKCIVTTTLGETLQKTGVIRGIHR